MCSGNSSAVENKRSVDGKACWRTEQSCCFQSCCQDGAASCGSLLTRTPRAVCHPPQAALSQSRNPCLRSLSDSGRICQLCNGNLQEAWPREKSTSPRVKRRDGEDKSRSRYVRYTERVGAPHVLSALLLYSCGHVFISHYHSVF